MESKKENIYAFKLITKQKILMEIIFLFQWQKRAVKVIPEVKDFVLFNGSGMGRKMTTKNKTVYQGDGMSVSESFFNFFHLN
jgi:putative ABC transport system permease protein